MPDSSTPEERLLEVATQIISSHASNLAPKESEFVGTKIVEINAVFERSGHSARRTLRILNAFDQAYEGLLGLLRAGREAKNCEALRRSSHALKGTLLDIGADGVAAIAAKAEQLSIAGDLDGAISLTQNLERGTVIVASIVSEIVRSDAAVHQ